MRTVDPEKWSKKSRTPSTRNTRLQFTQNFLETRIRSSFSDAMREYWRNCSVEGMKHLSDGNLSSYARWCYATALVLSLWLGLSLVAYSCSELQQSPPLQVNLQSSQHSILRIPFPAVALCSTNIIAKGPLMNYTRFLASKFRNSTYHSDAIREHMLKFGALVTMALPPVDVMFEQFLAHADPDFNVTKLMYSFSTSCSSLLTRCAWRGRIIPCDRMFVSRVTPLGYCCVFNSRYYSEDANKPPKYLDKVGQDYGLSVLVRQDFEDFAFSRRVNIGLEVLLFDGHEYPLLEGGGVRMYHVEQNASVYMSLSARAQYPAKEIVQGCRRRFVGGPRSRRSYAWCLAQCRRRTLAALCGCRLHTLPPDPDDYNPVCSLSHLGCLNKHREKFIYYYPTGYEGPSLDEELQNGQDCSLCAPDCTRYVYSAAVTIARYSQIFQNNLFFMNSFVKGQTLVNSSTIRLFFTSEHQRLYAVESNRKWYETFAIVSSQWSAVVGVTLVALPELLFHCTVRWVHHYRRRAREHDTHA